jgi:RNA polymerase sigma-54 factor
VIKEKEVHKLNLSQGLQTQLAQKLTLSREMLQSLELIQMPLLELRERIDKEILENPALEIDEKKNEQKSEEENFEIIENSFSEEANYFEDSSSAEISTGVSPSTSSADLKRQFLEGAISHKETLTDHLMWQLNLSHLDEKKKAIGETIISLIDPDGFFKEKVEEVFPGDIEEAKDVLETIQLFDPPGIAAEGIKESLLFQLESFSEDKINRNSYKIVKDHFDLMIARKDNIIAKILKITPEEVKEAFIFLGQFDPYPGRRYFSEESKYIIPDAKVLRRDNELVVEINDDILPSLTINAYMNKIANEVKRKRLLPDQKKYVVEKVGEAKRFIQIVRHRKQSLFRLVLAIVKNQEEFFFKGPKYIRPLTMREAAAEIGLSESTISRLASSKYIQTEWGIHEIKYFFSNSINRKGGDNEQSSESVREIIKEIISKEEGTKITDQKIVDILENRGIKIARRTVSKYRKILNILPSHHRNK